MPYRGAMFTMKTAILCHWKRPTFFLSFLLCFGLFLLYISSNQPNQHISGEFLKVNAPLAIEPITRRKATSTPRISTTSTTASQVYRVTFKDVAYSYNYSLLPVDGVCQKEPKFQVVVFILSAAEEAAQRDAIRNSWAEKASDMGALVLFVVGFVPELIANLTAEQAHNNDMIVPSIREHYRNLTLKVMSALQWKISRCPDIKYAFKTDSDVFVNPQQLVKYCETRQDRTNTIFGHVWNKVKPNRNSRHRWYTSNDSYSQIYWPSYASGPGYLMTSDVPAQLLSSSAHYNFIAIEDAFITGVLANHTNVKRTHDSGSFRWWKWKRFDACNPHDVNVISVHGFKTPDTMKQAWTQINTAKCTRPNWQEYSEYKNPHEARQRMMADEQYSLHRRPPPGWVMRDRHMPPVWGRRPPGWPRGRGRREPEDPYGGNSDGDGEGTIPPQWQKLRAQV